MSSAAFLFFAAVIIFAVGESPCSPLDVVDSVGPGRLLGSSSTSSSSSGSSRSICMPGRRRRAVVWSACCSPPASEHVRSCRTRPSQASRSRKRTAVGRLTGEAEEDDEDKEKG